MSDAIKTFEDEASRTLGNYASCRDQIGLDIFSASLLLCFGERDVDKSPIDDLHDKALAALTQAAIRLAVAELEDLITLLNGQEEYRDEPSRALKWPNHLILSRITKLEQLMEQRK